MCDKRPLHQESIFKGIMCTSWLLHFLWVVPQSAWFSFEQLKCRNRMNLIWKWCRYSQVKKITSCGEEDPNRLEFTCHCDYFPVYMRKTSFPFLLIESILYKAGLCILMAAEGALSLEFVFVHQVFCFLFSISQFISGSQSFYWPLNIALAKQGDKALCSVRPCVCLRFCGWTVISLRNLYLSVCVIRRLAVTVDWLLHMTSALPMGFPPWLSGMQLIINYSMII